jgi:hypothetical protein
VSFEVFEDGALHYVCTAGSAVLMMAHERKKKNKE